jgi:hypothetical protein
MSEPFGSHDDEKRQDPATAHAVQENSKNPASTHAHARGMTPVHRARLLVRSNPVSRIAWQVIVGLVGAGLLVAGAAMLVLPGPGWAVIAVGLVVLASEFVWFERPLRPVRRLLERTGVTTGSRRRKWLVASVAILGSVGGALVWVWGSQHGWNFLHR